MNFSISEGKPERAKLTSLLMATLENAFSTWGNSRVQLFLSTRWCISLSLVAFGHSWYGEMHQLVLRKSWTLELPHVEKIHLFTFQQKVNKQKTGLETPLVCLLYHTPACCKRRRERLQPCSVNNSRFRVIHTYCAIWERLSKKWEILLALLLTSSDDCIIWHKHLALKPLLIKVFRFTLGMP